MPLPREPARRSYREIVSGIELTVEAGRLPLELALARLPVAMLV